MDNYKVKHVKKVWHAVYNTSKRNYECQKESLDNCPSPQSSAEDFAITTKRRKCLLIKQDFSEPTAEFYEPASSPISSTTYPGSPATSESYLSVESFSRESASPCSYISEAAHESLSPSTSANNNVLIETKPIATQIPCQIQIMEAYLVPDSDGKMPIVHSNCEKALKNVQKEYLQVDCMDKWENRDKMDLVVIGPNGTTVSTDFLANLDWTSGSQVTRKLLTHIFDRDILATHTLTGKPSPAFKDQQRPSKQRLDPLKIMDIIHMVTYYTSCSPREVRMAITTKCADENKMFRNRIKKNKENIVLGTKE